MINNHTIIVLDFETDGKDPLTCNPVQLAALAINPRTLEIIPNSEFNSMMRPPDINKPDYFETHQENIEWHAKVQGKTSEEILETWKRAPEQKAVWTQFVDYLNQYHTDQRKRTVWTAPIIAGYNILQFDFPIIQRLSEKYKNVTKDGKSTLFYNRDKLDLIYMMFFWFESMPEPSSYNMDSLRDFFGMSTTGSHDALKDIRDTAELLIKFMKLIRKTADRVRFKGAFELDEKC
jgi:DNA polymerase III epsilon subunit-like protein